MGDFSGKIDVEKLISFSEDLVNLLKDKRDSNQLSKYVEDSNPIHSFLDADFNELQSLLLEYENKIDACRRKTEEAKSLTVADSELDLLGKELEDETRRESSLQEELRVVLDEITNLEKKGDSIEQRKVELKKLKARELQAQGMLSMYASVANTIPNLDDDSIVSGHIVEREKKLVQNFEFHQGKMDDFDTRNSIWGMINIVAGNSDRSRFHKSRERKSSKVPSKH